MIRRLLKYALILLFFPRLGFALTLSEDFSSATYRQSDSLVWNHSKGLLHPPLQVYQYLDGALQDRPFEVGNGGDGAFVPARYAEFSYGGDVSGQIIRIDTNAPILEVTDFVLVDGWTIEPVGDQPLEIRVLGDAIIEGTINCSGEDGTDVNADPSIASAGGRGRCGGGDGGNSGSLTIVPGAGLDGGPILPNGAGAGVPGPTGGAAASGGTGGGGGGGGAYAVIRGGGLDSTPGTGAGFGVAGKLGEDNDFDNEGGGFGGGGGEYYNAGAAAQNGSGGSGGGGGGHIFITAVGNISISGKVFANGGRGGGSDGVRLAGGGGGGGGGSIQLFAGGEVYLSGTGAVSAAGGAGQGTAGHVGGNGSAGRTWLAGVSGYSVLVPPLVTPEFPDPLVTDVGMVRYQLGTFTVASAEYDLANSHPTVTSVMGTSFVSVGGSLTISLATGSTQGFSPTWVDTAGVPFELSRFARFQVIVVNTDLLTPTQLSSITFTMTAFEQNEFDMVGACGRVAIPPANPAVPLAIFLLPLLVFGLLQWHGRKTKIKANLAPPLSWQ